ncbi:LytR/AlgR family response regulator transcription factor [Chondrinema litorale]|uniref:LytR/AlgR family response regulator transcription factor n=1 Tax=Chondrinema litorale TaxID=2994555 RepID=UPI002543E61E|nr:LytTR family DNA-binding domain-containing protein [Chondrinema litorale]UZR95034.1 LytTR family DNA-binding domain-containing protein [Chondrinema litorale]
MKIVIIEDETLAAKKMEQMLQRYSDENEIVAQLPSVEEAVEWLSENDEPDLIMADIQLSDGLSFEVFQEVKVKCPVIFTTAYDEYAIEAFKVNSIDYLLKPVRYNKLEEALEKLNNMSESLQKAVRNSKIDTLIGLLGKEKKVYKQRFLVKYGRKIKSVKAHEIAYFISEDKVVFIITFDNRKYAVNHSLEQLEEMMDPGIFFRINRQYLIHIDATQNIFPYFKGRLKIELTPTTNDEIVVSSHKAPLFKEWLDK